MLKVLHLLELFDHYNIIQEKHSNSLIFFFSFAVTRLGQLQGWTMLSVTKWFQMECCFRLSSLRSFLVMHFTVLEYMYR